MRILLLILLIATVAAVSSACTCVAFQHQKEMAAKDLHDERTRWHLILVNLTKGFNLSLVFSDCIVLGRGPEGRTLEGVFPIGDDPTISHLQCRLYAANDGLAIQNLSRVNVTLLNGIRLEEPQYLAEGDRIIMGGYPFLLASIKRS